MKSLFTILFSVWFLMGSFMPGNDAEELAKIPFLLEHFEEHSRGGGIQDFISFLHEHYDASAPEDQDHQQLPFAKHLQPCLLFIIPGFALYLGPVFSDLGICSAFPEVNISLLPGHSEPWQPPRIA